MLCQETTDTGESAVGMSPSWTGCTDGRLCLIPCKVKEFSASKELCKPSKDQKGGQPFRQKFLFLFVKKTVCECVFGQMFARPSLFMGDRLVCQTESEVDHSRSTNHTTLSSVRLLSTGEIG